MNRKIKEELTDQLILNKDKIVLKWASQIMKVPGHRRHKAIVSVERHKKGMSRFFKLFVAFLKNRHDTRSLKCLALLIKEGYLSINTAEDVIHGEMLLRKIIAEFLLSKYKQDLEKLDKMLHFVTAAIDVHILHISNVYRKRDFDRLHTLVRSGRKLVGARDLNRLLDIVIDTAIKESNADRASVMLSDKDGVLKINASVGIPEDIVEEAEERIGRGIAGKVAKTNKPIIINEGQKISEDIRRSMKGLSVVSAISIPIATEDDEVLGVLNLGKYPGKNLFDKEDVELLSILAYETATSIRSYQLVLETEGLYIGTIFALATALDARDHYTHGHSRKVARYAVSTAREMKLPKYEIDIIRRASLLHDIGKIGIPDKILNKPGRLTKKEYEIVKKHPKVALDILRPIPQLKDVLPGIYHEHERYDGRGYVAGLKGKAIPLEARIIGVADAFDAMTSERPYRKALSQDEAIEELKRNVGTQFDTKVVEAFLKTLKR